MKKWLTGCGIGCLVLVVLAVVGGTMLFRTTKEMVGTFDEVSNQQEKLRDLYGDVEHYTPPADGAVSAERLEAFLAVQAALKPEADELAVTLDSMRELDAGEGLSPRKVLTAFRGLGTLAPGIARALEARNEALLAEGMGLGEHTWLTATIYHGWLRRPLETRLDGDGESARAGRVRRHLRGYLERQRDAALALGDPGGIVGALEGELTEMTLDAEYLPWNRTLPEALERSLQPYRGRLEALATETAVMMGVGDGKDGDGFHFEID